MPSNARINGSKWWLTPALLLAFACSLMGGTAWLVENKTTAICASHNGDVKRIEQCENQRHAFLEKEITRIRASLDRNTEQLNLILQRLK